MGMREEMVQAGQSVAWMCRHGVVIEQWPKIIVELC
jgi:hypothetical protein